MRLLLTAALVVGAPLAAAPPRAPRAKPPPPPNIIFIMSDDHAEQAISAYGGTSSRRPTSTASPAKACSSDNAFVTNSICAPSRAVFLTGKYSHLNGLRDNRDEFDGSQPTFPKLLQKAGYQTAIMGKWHLKTAPTGFDHWKILIGQGEYYSPVFLDNGTEVRHDGYVTDLITDFALEYLEGRDRSDPFLLVYNHKAPHRNWMPAVRHLEMYADRDLPLPGPSGTTTRVARRRRGRTCASPTCTCHGHEAPPGGLRAGDRDRGPEGVLCRRGLEGVLRAHDRRREGGVGRPLRPASTRPSGRSGRPGRHSRSGSTSAT